MNSLQWSTPAGFLFTATASVNTSVSIVANGTNVVYSLQSGTLPTGLSVSSTGTIYGAPINVLKDSVSKFCIRATDATGIQDRTFIINVGGNTAPMWDTAAGFLNVGIGNQAFAINHQWVDYNLRSHDSSASTIRYKLIDGGLPPGLELSTTGRITGFVNDSLTFAGTGIAPGAYDTGKFDSLGYDPVLTFAGNIVVVQLTSQPKIYQFTVSVTDGDLSSSRNFQIMVANPDMFRADSVYLNYNDSALSTDNILANTTFIQGPQFLNGSDLGTIRADNNVDCDVSAYDVAPITGPITYSLVTGTTVSTMMPEGLMLDASKGHIYGYLPYQPAYTRTYSLTVNATKFNNQSASTITATNTFTLMVAGNVFSSIEWISESDLGIINAGTVSELFVSARELLSEYTIKYQITGGELPGGLALAQDGTITGRPDYRTGAYEFTVLASDVYGLSAISKTFKLKVSIGNGLSYTQIYVKPFLSSDSRTTYQNFINDHYVFDPKLIYRFYDSNFGIQKDIKMYLEYGIQLLDLNQYVSALDLNFYRRSLYFGDLKVGVAKNDAGAPIYEVVYLDIIDNSTHSTGTIATSSFDNYHPASIANMKSQLDNVVLLEDGAYKQISTDEYNLPLFMRTPQGADYSPSNYIPAMVLCYAQLGQGIRIANRIRRSGFDFRLFSFEIDRIIIENNLTLDLPNVIGPNIVPIGAGTNTAKYLLIDRQSITDKY